MANRQHFTTLQPAKGLPTPPPELPAELKLVFYPCYPIAFTPKPICVTGQWIAYTSYTFNNYFIDIQRIGGFDAYLGLFSSKSRSTLKRKLKKFADADGGSIEWKEYAKPEEIKAFFDLASPLSSKTYQDRLLDSGLPSSQAFKDNALKLAENNDVRGFILFLKRQPVAYVFSHCANGIVSYDYVGYDPEAQELSPGTVLQYLLLESLFAQKTFRIFDFTEGEGQQKAFFGTDSARCAKTYFFRKNLNTLLLVFFHYWLNQGVAAIGRLLNNMGVKDKIRKLIRRAA
jgi:CelD/BcsL family acetyltransferase involved in cellulose biosynthesis